MGMNPWGTPPTNGGDTPPTTEGWACIECTVERYPAVSGAVMAIYVWPRAGYQPSYLDDLVGLLQSKVTVVTGGQQAPSDASTTQG